MPFECGVEGIGDSKHVTYLVELDGQYLVRPSFLHLECLKMLQLQLNYLLGIVVGNIHKESHGCARCETHYQHPAFWREFDGAHLNALVSITDIVDEDLLSGVVSEGEFGITACRDEEWEVQVDIEHHISLFELDSIAGMRIEQSLLLLVVFHLDAL